MRVWTDGDTHVVVSEMGIEIHRGKQPPMLLPTHKRTPRGWPPRDVLAVFGGSPLCAWAGVGQEVRLVTLEAFAWEAPLAPVLAHVLDAVGLGEGRVLACIAEFGDPAARLVVVDGIDTNFLGARELTMPPVQRIVWPGGIWAKDEVPWPEDQDGEEPDEEPIVLNAIARGHALPDHNFSFDEVTFFVNEHGIVVTGVYAGIVAVMPPDASRIDFALRVPTQTEDTEIFAARTPAGVVVVICLDGQTSAILHCAPDGKVLASRSKIGRDLAWGMGPPIVQGDRVVTFEAGEKGGDRFHIFDLADLSVVRTNTLGERPQGQLSVASARDLFLIGMGTRAISVKRGVRGTLLSTPLERPTPPPSMRAIIPGAAPLAVGPPSLALARASDRPAPWELTVGQEAIIDVTFTNQGGPSRGVRIEIGGPALVQGLVRADHVRIGDVEAPLVTKGSVATAEVSDVALSAGLAPELTAGKRNLPLPAASILVARVSLVGLKAASAVLTVRITPLRAAPARGSVLQGKNLTVRS